MDKRIIFATANQSKLKEASRILSSYEIISPASMGIDAEVEESGSSLEENSLIKARYVFSQCQSACFADDTGLEVDALNGAPGVLTARYAGQEHDSNANMDKLLSELSALGPDSSRKARFRTVISLILSNGETHQFSGCVEGSIAFSKSGSKGFGYDPIFVPDFADKEKSIPNSKSLAEFTDSAKDAISHRGEALEEMRKFLEK